MKMRNIYCLSLTDLNNRTYTKLRFSKESYPMDLVMAHGENLLFVSFNDGSIKVYDLSKNKEVLTVEEEKESLKCCNTLDIDTKDRLLLAGFASGYLVGWQISENSLKNQIVKQKISTAKVLAIKFLDSSQYEDLFRIVVFDTKGKLSIFSLITEGKTTSLVKLYEITVFKPPFIDFENNNVWPGSFIKVSPFINVICAKNAIISLESMKINDGKEEQSVTCFNNYQSKFYYFFDNVDPLINKLVYL